LYKSVREVVFSGGRCSGVSGARLQGRHVSSIAQEKKRNPGSAGKDSGGVQEHHENLNLPYPSFIDYAVPGNRQCGVCPCDLPENLEKYCRHMTESPQG